MTGTTKGKTTSRKPSHLEEALAYQIRVLGLPEPVREYRAVPHRKYRWDFAWPEAKLLVECQGAVFVKGGHSTGAGISRDADKLNNATLHGFRSLVFTSVHIKDGSAVELIKEVLNAVE
jgi:very-short-patch-repair endonuclease